jgi:hypothetical protein
MAAENATAIAAHKMAAERSGNCNDDLFRDPLIFKMGCWAASFEKYGDFGASLKLNKKVANNGDFGASRGRKKRGGTVTVSLKAFPTTTIVMAFGLLIHQDNEFLYNLRYDVSREVDGVKYGSLSRKYSRAAFCEFLVKEVRNVRKAVSALTARNESEALVALQPNVGFAVLDANIAADINVVAVEAGVGGVEAIEAGNCETERSCCSK